MQHSIRWWQYFNVFSIDVAVGSVLGMYYWSTFCKTPLPTAVYFILASLVWSVYTLDHLLDAQKIKGKAYSFRHLYHQKHSKTLYVMACIVCGSACILACSLPLFYWKIGIGLTALSALYLFVCHSIKLTILWKEPLVALIYVLGMSLPSVLQVAHPNANHILMMCMYTSVAFSNLLLFSYLEKSVDQQHIQTSIATAISKRGINRMFIGLTIHLLIMECLLIGSTEYAYGLSLLVVFGIQLMLYLFPNRWIKNEAYRTFGDMAFWIPGCVAWGMQVG